MADPALYREIDVPAAAEGMRLDRFLALRFSERSRTSLARGVRDGKVTDTSNRPLRASTRLVAGQVLRLHLAGIAPETSAPPMPPILYEDDRFPDVTSRKARLKIRRSQASPLIRSFGLYHAPTL